MVDRAGRSVHRVKENVMKMKWQGDQTSMLAIRWR